MNHPALHDVFRVYAVNACANDDACDPQALLEDRREGFCACGNVCAVSVLQGI
jgi:hypothetical protein